MSTPSKVQLDHRYQLDSRVAAGGYGEVWRATDLVLGRPVAVKLLLAQHVQQPQTLARFRAEAQRAGALTHQNIARVYDYVEPRPPQPPFLVMELIDGPSLAQVLERGPLLPARVMDILAGAASGLQAAHDAGLVHRDIKPANLLVTRDGTVKITDFGISYAADSAPMTASGMLLGTAGYMAPERLGGGAVTGAADLYALGIVGYECLAGSAPFSGTPLEIAVAHRDRPLPPLPSSVPPSVAALIGALTAKDPAARPATAGEVARAAADQRDWLNGGATQAEYPGSVTGPRTAAYQEPTSPYGDQPATMAAPPGPVTPPGPYDPYGDPGRSGRHGAGGAGEGGGGRRKAMFAAVAAIVIIAAVAIGLVLTRSGGSPGPSVTSTTGPSATSAATAGGGGAGQPTTGPQTSAPAATTPAQHATTPAAPHTTPAVPHTTPAAPPTTAPAAPTASAAAATASAPANGNGNGNRNGNGEANGTSNGNGNGHH
ncbi:MAG TPA: serine/threonine-protein kinase [Streptosporangiaceae bacterium]